MLRLCKVMSSSQIVFDVVTPDCGGFVTNKLTSVNADPVHPVAPAP